MGVNTFSCRRQMQSRDCDLVTMTETLTGPAHPRQVTKQGSRDIPILEIPTATSNTIGVTRLLFNARGEIKRGVGLYSAVKEGETGQWPRPSHRPAPWQLRHG